MDKVINIVFAGRGGTGVITASDICAHAAFLSGFDVKKAGLKGIAQRGGLVISHLRYGRKVFSPKVEKGMADFVVSINDNDAALPFVSEEGTLIRIPPDLINRYGRRTNMYALGILSNHLMFTPYFLTEFTEDVWMVSIRNRFSDGKVTENIQAFLDGKASCRIKTSAV